MKAWTWNEMIVEVKCQTTTNNNNNNIIIII